MWPGSLSANGGMIRNVSIGDAINEMKFGQLYLNGKAQPDKSATPFLPDLMRATTRLVRLEQIICPRQHRTYNIYNTKYNGGSPYYGYPSFDRSKSLKERADDTQMTQILCRSLFARCTGILQRPSSLTLAGRYTYVKDSSYGTAQTKERHFSPRVGLNFSIDENTSVYALYDQTFSPQIRECCEAAKR